MISIVMPTRNSELYLKKSIDSILNQTYTEWELLIIDDASTDDTLAIIKEYTKKDSRIKLIHGPKEGIAAALNVGIENAYGEFIARMDSDDISLPWRFEKQISFLKMHPDVELCATNYQYIYACGELPVNATKCVLTDNHEMQVALLFSCVIAHPTVMFRRTLFDRGWRYDKQAVAEDYDLWTRMIPEVKIACLPEILLQYRVSEISASQQNNNLMYESAQYSAKKCMERVFEVDLSAYPNYLFGSSNNFQFADCSFSDFAIKVLDLMFIIDKQNTRLGVFNKVLLRKTMQQHWNAILQTVGLSEEFLDLEGIEELKLEMILNGEGNKLDANNKILNTQEHMEDFFKTLKHIAIYGVGKKGRKAIEKFFSLQKDNKISWEMEMLLDSNKSLVEIGGKEYIVYGPDALLKKQVDYVLISTAIYYDDICKKLIDLGMKQEQILSANLLYIIE